jgi:hypothetical protein
MPLISLSGYPAATTTFLQGLIPPTFIVANWPNFRLHNSEGAGKKYMRPSKLAAEFLSNICQKGPKTFS